MGIERTRLVKGELETVFGTENGSHSFFDIRAIAAALTTDQLQHDVEENLARITQAKDWVFGRRSNSKLSFGHYLRGDGTALDAAATATDDALQGLLKLCMGGSSSGAGSTIAGTGSTTTVINVATGHGARFLPGQAIMVEDSGGSGINEISVIESISSDALTLKIALTNAPTTAGKKVWNSYTAYVDPAATATWQFQTIGDHAADVFLALGCVGGFTLADLLQTEAGQIAKVNFDLMVTRWEQDTATLAAGTYDGGDLLGTTEAMEIHYQTHGTTTRNLISVSALDISPGLTWTQRLARGNGDKEQVDRYRLTQVAPTLSFTADPAAAFWTVHQAKTAKVVLVTFGRTAGQSWAIEIPNAKVYATPAREGYAEQLATRVSFRCFEDDCGAGTTALARSPIRIHRL